MEELQSNTPPYRSVLITGGTRGIGKACVYAFARAGYRVAFCYKESVTAANEIVIRLQNEGRAVCGFCRDISRSSEIKKLISETSGTIGKIDTLVNNAGIARKSLLRDETPESVNALLAANLFSIIELSRVYSLDMVQAGFGRIINLSSAFGDKGAACESVYAAAKGGVNAFTKSLAKELGLCGVTVNAVSPGLIDTEMNRELTIADQTEFLNRTAIGRAGTAEEVAALILFLASKDASYITGQIIGIDGGL